MGGTSWGLCQGTTSWPSHDAHLASAQLGPPCQNDRSSSADATAQLWPRHQDAHSPCSARSARSELAELPQSDGPTCCSAAAWVRKAAMRASLTSWGGKLVAAIPLGRGESPNSKPRTRWTNAGDLAGLSGLPGGDSRAWSRAASSSARCSQTFISAILAFF